MKKIFLIPIFLFLILAQSFGLTNFASDEFPAAAGKIKITFIGHATLMIEYNGKTIHVDPWSKLADYSKLPKADIILITHFHPDHYDSTALALAIKKGTHVI